MLTRRQAAEAADALAGEAFVRQKETVMKKKPTIMGQGSKTVYFNFVNLSVF
jgi:hypothetical protein